MEPVDFGRLRTQTMADGQDSEVTVNTRALIDKVLARYSNAHTTLRELIQNASDAGAKTVVIQLETTPSVSVPVPQSSSDHVLLQHALQHHTLKRLVVANDGEPFSDDDWCRLKSIADGNPDEGKIGAFGVGFYAVFADCDEPFVMSGNRTMAFYWKGNVLSTKIGSLPPEHSSAMTIFSLEYRQANPQSPSYSPTKVPELASVCQFLATSLTFVGLTSIELRLDQFQLASFSKKMTAPTVLVVPPGLKTTTEYMRISHVYRQKAEIAASWSNAIAPPKRLNRATERVQAEAKLVGAGLKNFFIKMAGVTTSPPAPAMALPAAEPGPAEEAAEHSKGNICLDVATLEVQTALPRGFVAEIERATKKAPPKATHIALLTSPYTEDARALTLSASGHTAALADRIFSDVVPAQAGHIFIGFPTAQTTGYLVHISAPSLIPTVERENIDLHSPWVATWNKELLYIAGTGCRAMYNEAMADLSARFDESNLAALLAPAVHTMKQFTSKPSHPSSLVGQTVDDWFWRSQEHSMDVVSSMGVLPSAEVRMPAETLPFLNSIPMVPPELANQTMDFIFSLYNHGFITPLTMDDIRLGLDRKALTEDELIEFLKWCANKVGSEMDTPEVRSLMERAVAIIRRGHAESDDGHVLELGAIECYYPDASRISPSLPMPPNTIPFACIQTIAPQQLQAFGWRELSLVDWLRFMTSTPQLEQLMASQADALQMLSLVSKTWNRLDAASQEAVCTLLRPHAVMPTKIGMKRPEESYFSSVKVFEDLPVLSTTSFKEKFLLALGVRKTIDLEIVFARMQAGWSKTAWSHIDLLCYFASVIDEIPSADMKKLRLTAFLSGEGTLAKPGQWFRAEELYAPNDDILALGLTQVQLPFPYRSSSREAQLLQRLGLSEFPTSLTLVEVMYHAGQTKDLTRYNTAMRYLLDNYDQHGYAKDAKELAATHLPILPTTEYHFPPVVSPSACFSSGGVGWFRFPVLRDDLLRHAEKLGVIKDPPAKEVVLRLLRTPPEDRYFAEKQFAYLAGRLADLESERSLIERVAGSKIVPIYREYCVDEKHSGWQDRVHPKPGKAELRLHHHDVPGAVFVGEHQEYRGILDYVHYGNPAAIAFLLRVGAKHEPTSHDLARLVSQSPFHFLDTIGQERYLELLKRLAESAANLQEDGRLWQAMSRAPFLLGYHDVQIEAGEGEWVDEDALDNPGVASEASLNVASDLVIIDDVAQWTRFRDCVVAVPQEELLEDFYMKLGASKITTKVHTSQQVGAEVSDQDTVQRLRKQLLERVRLFLHEYERDSSRKAVLNDAKWLEKSMSVQCVEHIVVEYTLRSTKVSVKEFKTAARAMMPNGGMVLYVTAEHDTYDVSKELVPVLLRRPKPNDAMALDNFLTESLHRLQAKGVNVKRILRRKEQEAQRSKQKELEEMEKRKRRAEDEGLRADHEGRKVIAVEKEAQHTRHRNVPNAMPGAFDSSGSDAGPSKLWSDAKDAVQNMGKKLGFAGENTTEREPRDYSRDLEGTRHIVIKALQACRPIDSPRVHSQHHVDTKELVKADYCDEAVYMNLRRAFRIPFAPLRPQITFWFRLGAQTEPVDPLIVPTHAFLSIVFNLATHVFDINGAAVNVFLDRQSGTVAFNLNGALFFNLGWFLQVHWPSFDTEAGRERAVDDWFATFCHELAHNVEASHGVQHTWYLTSIAAQYAPMLRRHMARLGRRKPMEG